MNFASNAPLFKIGTVRVQMQKHSEYKKECALRIKATNCAWAKESMVMCHENVWLQSSIVSVPVVSIG